jgi:hypothetical protein
MVIEFSLPGLQLVSSVLLLPICEQVNNEKRLMLMKKINRSFMILVLIIQIWAGKKPDKNYLHQRVILPDKVKPGYRVANLHTCIYNLK